MGIEVGKKTMSAFQTQALTRRCTLVYKLTGGCNQSSLTCGSFFLPNKDPQKCRRGDRMYVRSAGTQPRAYCDTTKPTRNFPVVSQGGDLKITVDMSASSMYPKKGVKCVVKCDNFSYHKLNLQGRPRNDI